MLEEKKDFELKEAELEKVTGGESEQEGQTKQKLGSFTKGKRIKFAGLIYEVKENIDYYSDDDRIPCTKTLYMTLGVASTWDESPTAGELNQWASVFGCEN